MQKVEERQEEANQSNAVEGRGFSVSVDRGRHSNQVYYSTSSNQGVVVLTKPELVIVHEDRYQAKGGLTVNARLLSIGGEEDD
mmetsp:Transcript_36077/g.56327  ORF Transcript_36077/g.56327 Transcript_36077/m.56327 type:complete len:83 (-) Transcript_36077:1882-2130(-)